MCFSLCSVAISFQSPRIDRRHAVKRKAYSEWISHCTWKSHSVIKRSLIDKAPLTGGIRTHDTRIFRSAAIPLSYCTIAVGAFYRSMVGIDGSSIQGRSKKNLHCWLALSWPSSLFVSVIIKTSVGGVLNYHRLQVHHTLINTKNRGKKVANPDFYVWIRKFFCFSSRCVSFFTKSSGKTTFKTGPKDKTRIKSSVSSSFS